ncbi:MAG TPA: hypothetical protein DIS79_01795 [Bacteroidetes bacterium]|nr:hypothetical protein [Bacteroidota bacterium]HRK03949.1 hypothetical protein [Chlorobiota bacterium]
MITMRMPFIVVVLVIVGFVTTSCLRSVVTIKVARDHSAVLVDSTTLGTGAINMMRQLSSISKKSVEQMLSESFSETSIKSSIRGMGRGVKLKSITKLTGKQKGYVSTYTIDDINNLTYNRLSALEKGPSTTSSGIQSDQYKAPMKFIYVDSVLTISLQQTNFELEERTSSPTDSEAREQIDNMKRMMSDLYVAVRVIPEASIISSNGAYVNNGVITLAELDMGAALQRFEQDLQLYKQFVESKGNETKLKALSERMGCCFHLETQPSIRTVLR